SRLGEFYAKAILDSGIAFDVLFGPAYKGIPLVAAIAIALAGMGRNVPFAFNRKEAKDHGEGGTIVGRALQGRVVIVDDVITAGTAIRKSVDLIRGQGAEPVAVLLALDRQERGQGAQSAVQEIESAHGLKCVSLLSLSDLIETVGRPAGDRVRISEHQLADLRAYRERYGVA
ncbi:MAG: orotate phosphoribosyltransferase, partial [Rubrivivax sp.]